jgi:hypothetical protein
MRVLVWLANLHWLGRPICAVADPVDKKCNEFSVLKPMNGTVYTGYHVLEWSATFLDCPVSRRLCVYSTSTDEDAVSITEDDSAQYLAEPECDDIPPQGEEYQVVGHFLVLRWPVKFAIHISLQVMLHENIFSEPATKTIGLRKTVCSPGAYGRMGGGCTANPLIEWWDSYAASHGNEDPGETGTILKWTQYFPIYHRHFQDFRHRPLRMLEIGVAQGGSISMWKSYFGDSLQYIGVDINPEAKRFHDPKQHVNIFIGDAENRTFWQSFRAETKVPLDIIIDDGGHTGSQQIIAFEELYPLLQSSGGIYFVEDVQTSYWAKNLTLLREEKLGTFVDYAKAMVDQLNAYNSEDRGALAPNEFTRTTTSVQFYDGIVLFEKWLRSPLELISVQAPGARYWPSTGPKAPYVGSVAEYNEQRMQNDVSYEAFSNGIRLNESALVAQCWEGWPKTHR